MAKVFKDLPFATQAALRCREGAFQAFLRERFDTPNPPGAAEGYAAEAVREFCGVASRAELAKDPAAGEKWRRLNRTYEDWLLAATIF
jgi:hypothetical protein